MTVSIMAGNISAHINIFDSNFWFCQGTCRLDAWRLGTCQYWCFNNFCRDVRFSFSRLGVTSKSAFLPLLTPCIIIGGILSGIFTPTESAIAAVVYALLLGLFVYRSLTWRHILRVSMDTIETSAAILMIVASATIFAWILIDQQVAVMLGDALLGFSQNKTVIMLRPATHIRYHITAILAVHWLQFVAQYKRWIRP